MVNKIRVEGLKSIRDLSVDCSNYGDKFVRKVYISAGIVDRISARSDG